MSIGFDFGTANCSVARYFDNKMHLLPLSGSDFYVPSTLSAPSAEAISEYLFRSLGISPLDENGETLLRRAIKTNREEGLKILADDVHFGQSALENYLEDPKFVYFVKSPKSFLGTLGLRDMQISFFEDLVCAMMANIKQKTEHILDAPATDVMIGRPINYHSRGGEKSNQQAINIMTRAAKRAGFKHVEFQYEPVAAGFEYESTLTSDKMVLVIDIGGGTSDCSLIRMGPSWRNRTERADSLLAHRGRSTGGNDLDIAIAFKRFMPEFGLGTLQLSGLPVPIPPFWNGIAINDVVAQRDFYNLDNLKQIKELQKNAVNAEKLARLAYVHQGTLGHSIVQQAEKTKIALGSEISHEATLDLLKEQINVGVTQQQMAEAVEAPFNKIRALINDIQRQAATKPDVVYLTGGSARSPMLRQSIKAVFPDIPIVSGDYFGSVTAGLARWSDLCFR